MISNSQTEDSVNIHTSLWWHSSRAVFEVQKWFFGGPKISTFFCPDGDPKFFDLLRSKNFEKSNRLGGAQIALIWRAKIDGLGPKWIQDFKLSLIILFNSIHPPPKL